MIKETIATVTWCLLHGIGLLLFTQMHGFLYWLGIINYAITYFILLFVVTIYMQSDYYKNLGKEE